MASALGASGCRRTPLRETRCPPAKEKMSVQESPSFVSPALPPRARVSCGQTPVGGLDSLSGRGFGHTPLGPRPAQCGGHVQQSRLRASHSRPWGALSHRGGLVGTSVAATAVTPGPVWGTEGGSGAEAWLGSCPSQRRASHAADAGCQQQHWGTAGHSRGPWDPRPCASQWLPALSARHGSPSQTFRVRQA